jgi:hypothetical protein
MSREVRSEVVKRFDHRSRCTGGESVKYAVLEQLVSREWDGDATSWLS